VRTPRGTLHVTSRLVGRPNVYNILAAVSTATALDVPFDAIERGLTSLVGVPGRFQVVSDAKDEVTVVVDYAHTDDALRNLLETARPLAQGRLITVFGCGGDRDRTKRPLMGAVAGRLSDLIVITSDNPRSEDPNRIIEEVQRGITPDTRRDATQRVLAIVDRRAAIAKAIELAGAGDVVLVAGKGHEKYQVIGDRTLPFDDVAVAREALLRRRTRSGVAK
jgi:UDP-N-acetylmuramoyl-L-alanyl-D-glutamate--2,6-diaminopimelate ligase